MTTSSLRFLCHPQRLRLLHSNINCHCPSWRRHYSLLPLASFPVSITSLAAATAFASPLNVAGRYKKCTKQLTALLVSSCSCHLRSSCSDAKSEPDVKAHARKDSKGTCDSGSSSSDRKTDLTFRNDSSLYNFFHKYRPVMDAPTDTFSGLVDRFNGITVTSAEEYDANVDFAVKLQKSLDHWIAVKRRTIWFKVCTEHADWVPILAKAGFTFHHVNDDAVFMARWLPNEETPNMPEYAHTMLGVGGLVVNENDEVLVVTDRFALIPKSWKLPGGYVNSGENIIDAAKREVREETGIETDFKTLISVRHTHGGNFNCSDLYFVVALTPKNLNIVRQEVEIARAQWMPIAEFLEHPHVHETNRYFMKTFLSYKQRGLHIDCIHGRHQVLRKEYCLYCMSSETEQPKPEQLYAATPERKKE